MDRLLVCCFWQLIQMCVCVFCQGHGCQRRIPGERALRQSALAAGQGSLQRGELPAKAQHENDPAAAPGEPPSPFPLLQVNRGAARSPPEQLSPASAAASNNGRFLIISSLINRKHLRRFSEAEAHKWLNCTPENSVSRSEKEVTKQRPQRH